MPTDSLVRTTFITAIFVLTTSCILRPDMVVGFLARMRAFVKSFVRASLGRRATYCCELMVDCAKLSIRIFNDIRRRTKSDPSIREARIYYDAIFMYNIAVPEGVPPDLDVNSDIKELPQTWKIDGYNGQ